MPLDTRNLRLIMEEDAARCVEHPISHAPLNTRYIRRIMEEEAYSERKEETSILHGAQSLMSSVACSATVWEGCEHGVQALAVSCAALWTTMKTSPSFVARTNIPARTAFVILPALYMATWNNRSWKLSKNEQVPSSNPLLSTMKLAHVQPHYGLLQPHSTSTSIDKADVWTGKHLIDDIINSV